MQFTLDPEVSYTVILDIQLYQLSSYHGLSVRVSLMGTCEKSIRPDNSPVKVLKMEKQAYITVFGNKKARRCQATSRRSGVQCRNAAVKASGKVCRFHGYGGGPRTAEGRQRCADAKRVHGNETRAIRKQRSRKLAELRQIEAEMVKLGMLRGNRTPGRKPKV